MMGCYEAFMTHNNIALTDKTWEKHCHVVSGEKLLYLVMERALKRAMTLPESDGSTGSCEYNTSDCGPRCPTSILSQYNVPLMEVPSYPLFFPSNIKYIVLRYFSIATIWMLQLDSSCGNANQLILGGVLDNKTIK